MQPIRFVAIKKCVIPFTGNVQVPELTEYPMVLSIGDQLTLGSPPVAFDGRGVHHYPFLKYFVSVVELENILQDLSKDVLPRCDGAEIVSKFYNRSHICLLVNESIVFKHHATEEESYKYIKLIDYFQEEPRVNTRRGNRPLSAGAFYMTRKTQIHTGAVSLTYESIYNAARKCGFYLCSEFNPLYMITIVNYLKQFGTITNILDMSAGRGSRMLAAMILGARYTGVDPCEGTHQFYTTMHLFYSSLLGRDTDVKIHKSGFETLSTQVLATRGPYDLMLSSPPYFDLEIYEDNENQSVTKFTTLETWVRGFLYPSMSKTLDLLRVDGFMVINMDNPRHQPTDFVKYLLEFQDPKAVFKGCIQILSRNNLPFSFWCWQRC